MWRSTKAGASAPATLGLAGAVPDRAHARSTKAGASAPATPPEQAKRTVLDGHRRPLNEGRGVSPGDTGDIGGAKIRVQYHAQRRPGRQPRRHSRRRSLQLAGAPERSTKAGASAPCDTFRRQACNLAELPHPLNEGRGVSPGDTSSGRTSESCRRRSGAQRRPGRQPRRHCRSAKAHHRMCLAQRRPGRQPRRHDWGASTSASVAEYAQRRPGRQPRRHSTFRELVEKQTLDFSGSLNEGRGVSPGDTESSIRKSNAIGGEALNEGRGVSPGDTSYDQMNALHVATSADLAQRRPGRQPRRHISGPGSALDGVEVW